MKHKPIVLAACKRYGVVYTGKRHAQIIKDMVDIHKCTPPIRQDEQGFVDEDGRFYTRLQAEEIAIETGQIPKDFRGVLLSEHLW